jgi:hypothetical protein
MPGCRVNACAWSLRVALRSYVTIPMPTEKATARPRQSKVVLYGGGLRSNKQQSTGAYRKQQNRVLFVVRLNSAELMIVTFEGSQP